jgi:hypothetical protein
VESEDDGVMRNVTVISWICTLAPIVLLVIFATLAIHVRLGLGYWPRPAGGDGYETGLFHFHTSAFMLWFLFAFVAAPPIWVASVIVGWREPRMLKIFAFQVAVFLAGWALVYTVAAWNPAGFAEWFFD